MSIFSNIEQHWNFRIHQQDFFQTRSCWSSYY